jgi:hypothetical protein
MQSLQEITMMAIACSFASGLCAVFHIGECQLLGHSVGTWQMALSRPQVSGVILTLQC